MRLKYRILWFENDGDFIQEVGSMIKEYLAENLGLELDLNTQRSGSNLVTLLKEGESYDLILTDLNLDNDDEGNELIDQIRADKILTEVLMYSADGAKILKVRDDNPGLERVSFSVGRGALPEKLRRIVDLTVRKVQDVHNMRGLVIAEAIDLEDKMLDILINHFSAAADDASKVSFIESHVANAKERFDDHIEKISSHKPEQILDFLEIACGEMNAKYNALQKLLRVAKGSLDTSTKDGKIKMESLTGLEAELKGMSDDVINLRNDLAHVLEEKNADGNWVLRNKKQKRETVFDNAKYVEIRRNLRSHANNLAEIAKHIPWGVAE